VEFREIFLSLKGKFGKNEKKSTQEVEKRNLEKLNWKKLFENFLQIFEGLIFFRIYEKFFITDSKSTDHDPSLSDGIFGLPTSELEVAIFSRTVGARCLVSQAMLLRFERRVERHHPSIGTIPLALFVQTVSSWKGRFRRNFSKFRRKNRKDG